MTKVLKGTINKEKIKDFRKDLLKELLSILESKDNRVYESMYSCGFTIEPQSKHKELCKEYLYEIEQVRGILRQALSDKENLV